MRILLNTIPRAASKWFHQNITEYYYIKENLSRNYNIVSWFENFDQHSILPHKIQAIDGYETVSPMFNDNHSELIHRLNLLLNSDMKFILKIHPVNLNSVIAIEKLKKTCNYYYTIRKRDMIDQSLSIITTSLSGIAVPSQAQRKKISELIDNPSIVPFEKFRGQLIWVKRQNDYLDNQNPSKHLYYEDLIQIKTSEEFCKYLDLPHVDFEIQNKFGVEHGDNKQKIIRNYEELKKYGEILYRYNRI